MPEFKYVVTATGAFPADFVQSLQLGGKLQKDWTLPATSTVDPCYVTSVPSGSKVLRIQTVTGEGAEDASAGSAKNVSADANADANVGGLPSLPVPTDNVHLAEKHAYQMFLKKVTTAQTNSCVEPMPMGL